MTNMLSVTDLDVNYGSSQVLFQLKLHVKKGETLFSIAQKFFTTVDFLKQLNKLKTPR